MATKQAMPDELEQLTARSPELSEVAAFYSMLSPLIRQHRQSVEPFHLDREKAHRKLEAGIPLLAGEEIPFDSVATRALFLSLCKKMEAYRTNGKSHSTNAGSRQPRSMDFLSLWGRAESGDAHALRSAAIRQIRRSVERGELDLQAVWAMLSGGEDRKLELTARGLQLDPGLLQELARLSLKPAFQVWSEGLQAEVSFDHWGRGSCPVCGSVPALSETQGKEAARRLRCGLCGASWRYPHLKCAFCGNHDYRKLVNLTVEGEEERYKVQACTVCNGYIKGIKTFDPIPVDKLPVQDLATIHLDMIAAAHGYQRLAASGAVR